MMIEAVASFTILRVRCSNVSAYIPAIIAILPYLDEYHYNRDRR
jgi:hypothetical protein